MKYLLPILILLALSGCATKPKNETTITGTRISKSDFEDGDLIEVKPLEGETVFDMLMRLQGLDKYPKMGSFENCKELLSQLKEKGIETNVVEERKVVIKDEEGNDFSYTFNEGSCL